MARKETTQSKEPGRPNLVVPRPEAKDKISKRIDKGAEIIDQLISPNRPFFMDDAQRERAKAEYNEWSAYNRDLLKSLFSDSSFANGYGMLAVFQASQTPNDLRKRIKEEIKRLNSIVGRLEIFPELREISRPAPPSAVILTMTAPRPYVPRGPMKNLKYPLVPSLAASLPFSSSL